MYAFNYKDELYHHGVKGQKWGVRRYQKRMAKQLKKAYKEDEKYRKRNITTHKANLGSEFILLGNITKSQLRKLENKLKKAKNSKTPEDSEKAWKDFKDTGHKICSEILGEYGNKKVSKNTTATDVLARFLDEHGLQVIQEDFADYRDD